MFPLAPVLRAILGSSRFREHSNSGSRQLWQLGSTSVKTGEVLARATQAAGISKAKTAEVCTSLYSPQGALSVEDIHW